MRRRLWLVYNPRSSQYGRVEEEVLAPARKLGGFLVGKYMIRPEGFRENVARIARMCEDGDLMVVAGGDGTVAMAVNGVLEAGKDVKLGVLGYGNLNDVAGMLGEDGEDCDGGGRHDGVCVGGGGLRGDDGGGFVEMVERLAAGETRELYPLEVKVNGEHWRYAIGYVTVGLLARATMLMETPEMRERLAAGERGSLRLLAEAVKWYLKHRRESERLEGTLNGVALARGTTDYLAVNGSRVARMMKAEGWWREERVFGSGAYRLGGLWGMVKFATTSIRRGMPLATTEGDVIEFARPSAIEIQTEGEMERLEGVEKIEVRKAGKIAVV